MESVANIKKECIIIVKSTLMKCKDWIARGTFYYEQKRFLNVLCSIMVIFLFSACSLSKDKSTSKAASTKAADGNLYPAYKIVDNVKKWGYLNSKGEFVIQPQFDNAEPFNKDNIARITQNDLTGIIDKRVRY